jgi:hypothetical protein
MAPRSKFLFILSLTAAFAAPAIANAETIKMGFIDSLLGPF